MERNFLTLLSMIWYTQTSPDQLEEILKILTFLIDFLHQPVSRATQCLLHGQLLNT